MQLFHTAERSWQKFFKELLRGQIHQGKKVRTNKMNSKAVNFHSLNGEFLAVWGPMSPDIGKVFSPPFLLPVTPESAVGPSPCTGAQQLWWFSPCSLTDLGISPWCLWGLEQASSCQQVWMRQPGECKALQRRCQNRRLSYSGKELTSQCFNFYS